MNKNAETLFEYLRNVIYDPKNANLDIDSLDQDFNKLGQGLAYFAQCIEQLSEFATALSNGDFHADTPPSSNQLAAPLKGLHSSLMHLTWQAKQVAKGDYSQRVDFMGEFASAFNMMIEQLADRQEKLEMEIKASQAQTASMQHSNNLLSSLVDHIPHQLFVVSGKTHEVFLANSMAEAELAKHPDYLKRILDYLVESGNDKGHREVEFFIPATDGHDDRYLNINTYVIQWHGVKSLALAIDDVSYEKRRISDLEIHAHYDSLTKLYTRFFGMRIFNEWLESRRQFSLIFMDMDSLKFINDKYGHADGDIYITRVADCLRAIPGEIISCRLGGDEFMVLLPDTSYDEAHKKALAVQKMLGESEYLEDKDYTYSVSYGIVEVSESTTDSSAAILGRADELMYEHKRARKKGRDAMSAGPEHKKTA